MAEYVSIDQATQMAGLRVVLPPGIPGPWGEAVKGILHVKKIPFIRVRHDRADYSALFRWTAQSSAPVVVLNDERPRSMWLDQLYLAERLQPEPPLIPAAIDDRVAMFGLSNELCGENGLAWSRRLMMVHSTVTDPKSDEATRKGTLAFGNKYGYVPNAAETAPLRVAEIVRTLARRLESQRARDSAFFIGDRLSALDIYWATFAALIQPLPEQLCPMTPDFRRRYECNEPEVQAALTPQLLAHRDFIYQNYLELPVDL